MTSGLEMRQRPPPVLRRVKSFRMPTSNRRIRSTACSRLQLVTLVLFWMLFSNVNVSTSPRNNTSILALFFPQFHSFEQNSRLWGQDFTEWSHLRNIDGNGSFDLQISWPGSLGWYDLMNKSVRRRQGELARRNGVDGFVYYHYWLEDGPVMEKALLKMLDDGFPQISFALCWANEPWTKRWDGGNNDILLDQSYRLESATRHYSFLKLFFLDPRYLRGPNGQGRLLFMYRGTDFARPGEESIVAQIIDKWQTMAMTDGIGPLHIVQFLGSPTQTKSASWASGTAEFWPGFANVLKMSNEYVTGGGIDAVFPFKYGARCHYSGSHAGWNTIPRQLSSGRATWSHSGSAPYAVEKRLDEALRRAERYSAEQCLDFVLVNAWNEWGEGNILEPDLRHGRGNLGSVLRASRRHLRRRGLHDEFPLPVEVCFVVRTFGGHVLPSAMYQLKHLFQSLMDLQKVRWHAVIVDTDDGNPLMDSDLQAFDLSRCTLLTIPTALRRSYWNDEAAYIVTDWAIRQVPVEAEWVVITNGDNFYDPQSFQWIQAFEMSTMDYDMVLMPFASRYVHGDYLASLGSEEKFLRARCRHRGHVSRYADIGAVAFRLSRLISEDFYFSSFWPKFSVGQDNAAIDTMKLHGWKVFTHSGSDLFYHNPNLLSCESKGGVWLESPLFSEAQCYSRADFWQSVVDENAIRVSGRYFGFRVLLQGDFCAYYADVDYLRYATIWNSSKPKLESANKGRSQSIARLLLKSASNCGWKFDVNEYIKGGANCSSESCAYHFANSGFTNGLPYQFVPSGDISILQHEERRSASMRDGFLGGIDYSACFLFESVAVNHIARMTDSCEDTKGVSSEVLRYVELCPLFVPSVTPTTRYRFLRQVCGLYVSPSYLLYHPHMTSEVDVSEHFFGFGIAEGRKADLMKKPVRFQSGHVKTVCEMARSLSGAMLTDISRLCLKLGASRSACGMPLTKTFKESSRTAIDTTAVGQFKSMMFECINASTNCQL